MGIAIVRGLPESNLTIDPRQATGVGLGLQRLHMRQEVTPQDLPLHFVSNTMFSTL